MNQLLNSFREYYLNNGKLEWSAYEVVDDVITMLVKKNESASPGFYTFFGFQNADDFTGYFIERFWEEKLQKDGLRLICDQDDDDGVNATLWFLAKQFNNTVFVTQDVESAKDVLNTICEKLLSAGMIQIANSAFKRTWVISKTNNFNPEQAYELFDERFKKSANKTSALAVVLLELESVTETRYFTLIEKITPFYGNFRTIMVSPGNDGDGPDDEEEGSDELEGGVDIAEDDDEGEENIDEDEFGSTKFSSGSEKLTKLLSDIIENEPIEPENIFCPFRTKQNLKDAMKEAGIEFDPVKTEILRRLELDEINAFMLKLLLQGNRQGPVGNQAVTRICELLGVSGSTYYDKLKRFQAVMFGLRDDERYASEDAELVSIIQMFYNVYKRNCVYEPAA
ncbi:MAG: hypothetical protein AMXMBFR49_28840 [Chlorobiota bacterium]|nr:MAG: hypothetical protein EDM75_13250 [Chlorobiota bacterium]